MSYAVVMTTIGHTPDGTDIAGWVLRANPKTYDVDAELDANGLIEDWSVHESYRTKLMGDGQRCFLWRSGPEGAVIAAGYIRGPVYPGQADPKEWVDESKARDADLFVPVELYPLFEEIPRAVLKGHPVLANVEFLRVRQGSNPSILTPEELDALEEIQAETDVAPWLAAVVVEDTTWFVPLIETDEHFTILEARGGADPIETGRYDSIQAAVLAAVAIASPQIDNLLPVDPELDASSPIVDVREDDGKVLLVFKAKDGFQAYRLGGSEPEVLGSGRSLNDLLTSLVN